MKEFRSDVQSQHNKMQVLDSASIKGGVFIRLGDIENFNLAHGARAVNLEAETAIELAYLILEIAGEEDA